WAEMAPYAGPGPEAALAAHERVVRGEDLRTDGVASSLPPVLELPLVLQPWEPAYPLAEYRPDKADFPSPTLPPATPVTVGATARVVDDPESVRALTDLASIWVTESNGRSEAVAVEGTAVDA